MKALVLVLIVVFVYPNLAFAYLDPGTGSYIVPKEKQAVPLVFSLYNQALFRQDQVLFGQPFFQKR